MTKEQAGFLLERHGGIVWRLCGRLCGHLSNADREDLFQETFLRVMSSEIAEPEAESARNFLYTVCLNAYRSEYAKRKRRGGFMAAMPENYDAPNDFDTEAEAGKTAAARAAREAVLKLPDKYRLPVEMYYFAGWTSAQIAKALNTKETTVRSNLHRARKKLAYELEEWI